MKKKLLPILILGITFYAAIYWSPGTFLYNLGNTFIFWGISFVSIISVLRYKKREFNPSNKKDYRIVAIYFVWMLIGVIRGCFVAENYWEWKQLISGTLALSVPVFIYAFSMPDVLKETLRYWMRYALWGFLLFFIWLIVPGAYHFYLGPIFLIGCFAPVLPPKYRLILIILLLIMCVITLGARSQVIKAVVTLLLCLLFYFRSFINIKVIKFIHLSLYLIPVVLLFLGISGVFNVFQDFSKKNSGKYVEKRAINKNEFEEDLSTDTRTFIYEEVIESALRHNYVVCGRTPARGNDSRAFGFFNAEELNTGKYERHQNEVCHPNIFTWLGLIGVILYSILYLKSSYLAIYKSDNRYIKLIGLFIAFNWAYGWIENATGFNIMNISIGMAIAMGFSESFRSMNDREFRQWIIDIFKK